MVDYSSMSPTITELNGLLDGWLRWYKFRQAILWALRGLVSGLSVALALSLITVSQGQLLETEFFQIWTTLALGGLIIAAFASIFVVF